MACDECHLRRVRCNGENPCSDCHQNVVNCTYLRPTNRRGGASLKQRQGHLNRRQLRAQRAAMVPISSRLNGGFDLLPFDEPSIYPILLPVLGELDFLTPSVASDMLETYFQHSAWGNSHMLRKSSVLTMDASKIRRTKPALIYAIMCFSAQHHDFGSIGITRSDAIDRLFELTVSSVVLFHNLDKEPSLDDVISYIQLASVLSASKYQKKSVEWWSATYLLAKQLRLNEECDSLDITEQEKEERRRTWWLLYCVDRHQALAVRKPLSFRDAECQELLRPFDEGTWNSENDDLGSLPRTSGITYQVTDCSFFGFILPLMSILGEIIELHTLQESECGIDAEPKRGRIKKHLDTYDQSLSECIFDDTEFERFMCYARHTLSTLHILFATKWDPLDVLTDVEAHGLSQEVIYSAAMATIAANSIRDIQHVDPAFDFLPLFFGLFLLQCSFPLLLVMKTFGTQSDENIIGACEIIMNAYKIRFHPDDTVGDPSLYWSNFAAVTNDIKSMKSPTEQEVALQTMQDIDSKVREIVGLYRWNRTGQGLHT